MVRAAAALMRPSQWTTGAGIGCPETGKFATALSVSEPQSFSPSRDPLAYLRHSVPPVARKDPTRRLPLLSGFSVEWLRRAVPRIPRRDATSLRPRRPPAVLPRDGGGGARALARAATSSRASSPSARARPSGASTRARRPRTGGPAPTTSSRASSRTSTRATRRCAATTYRARPAGTATGCRSSSRSRGSSGSPPRRRSRSTASTSSTSAAGSRSSATSTTGSELTERIGFWVDMDDAYRTLDNDYIESVWWSLRQHWDRDRLYEGHKVVPYCPRCGTALSSHEVAQGYEDQVDPSRVRAAAGRAARRAGGLRARATRCWSGRRRRGR